jgi:hypothetical protein
MRALARFWGAGRLQIDWRSIWSSFRVELLFVLSIVIERLAAWASAQDFGDLQLVIVGVIMFVLNLARKFLKDYLPPEPGPGPAPVLKTIP